MMQIRNPIWQTVDAATFKPDYIDVNRIGFRSYGASIQMDVLPERFVLRPDARPIAFLKYFAIFFLPMFAAIAYVFVSGPEKWLFVVGGPIFGGIAFSVIYMVLLQEIQAGPYFEFYPDKGVIRLPRYDVEFMLSEVECLQWITGGSKTHGADRATDLNLIVQTSEGEKRRYFLIGSPSRRLATAISEKTCIPIYEVKLGLQGKRDLDASVHA